MRYREISCWYWLVTVILLATGLGGWSMGFTLAMVLCSWQVVHFAWRKRSPTAFPVQVRVAYLAMLVGGQWEPLYVFYWIQLVGTTAMVLFDYCFLARVLSLLPWNRQQPLSLRLAIRTIFSAPVCGSIVEANAAKAGVKTPDCTERNQVLEFAHINH